MRAGTCLYTIVARKEHKHVGMETGSQALFPTHSFLAQLELSVDLTQHISRLYSLKKICDRPRMLFMYPNTSAPEFVLPKAQRSPVVEAGCVPQRSSSYPSPSNFTCGDFKSQNS